MFQSRTQHVIETSYGLAIACISIRLHACAILNFLQMNKKTGSTHNGIGQEVIP